MSATDPHGIVFAAIVPHGAPSISASGRDDEPAEARATQEAFLELTRRLRASGAGRVVIMTPHNVHLEGQFAVVEGARMAGNLTDWGNPRIQLEGSVDRPFAIALAGALREAGIPVAKIFYGGNDPTTATHPMDWATLIPLWYLGGRFDQPLPAVVVSPARDRSVAEHEAVGRVIAEAAARGPGRTALIASCDHGHGHLASGPYGFRPESAVFDDLVMGLLREDRLGELSTVDPDLVEAAAADSWWQMLMLHGALGDAWRPELLSYEHPTYFGMAVCAFSPAG